MTRDELIHRIKTAYNCGSAEGVASHYGEDTLHLRGQYLCQRDALLAEFDRLRDCERVVWCLSVGHTLWFKKFGRAGHETIRMWVGVHTMTREPHYELHRWDGKEFHTYSLGPNFSISESADPDRVRAIIDQEMAKETGK